MTALPLPATAAWQHLGARDGFEVASLQDGAERVLVGTTTAVEDGVAWVVSYRLVVDARWCTREASVHARTGGRTYDVHLQGDGHGRWRVDGAPAAHLDGCLDVDLESSALTNTLPVHRLALGVGETAAAPAAYVRALDLGVERLEQDYRRLEDGEAGQRYAYAAPVFDVACALDYGPDLLVRDYPGLARRLPVAG